MSAEMSSARWRIAMAVKDDRPTAYYDKNLQKNPEVYV